MNNKYCYCISLYDNIKLSEYNLYYYIGIIEKLMDKNRDYDIRIDLTPYCYEILLKIIKQENINTNNVYFILHKQCKSSEGMFWRIYTLFNNLKKYELVCCTDSENLRYYNDYDIYLNNPKYSIYDRSFEIDCDLVTAHGDKEIINGGQFCICYKNLKSNFSRILECVNFIYNNNYFIKNYNFDQEFLSSLLYKEYIENNIVYIGKDTIKHNTDYNCNIIRKKYNIQNYYFYEKLKFYDIKNNLYYIDNIGRLFLQKKKPICKNLENYESISNIDYKTRLYRKYIFTCIKKYINENLNYINPIFKELEK